MFDEYEKKKRKEVSLMKSIMDYGMGILIILAGLFFLFHKMLKIPFGDDSASIFDKIFGVMCLLYGSWRVYRGYKKNYFR